MKVPTPAAMEGEQFEVWGVDEAPLPAEMIAKQEKLIPVACRLCATLMYAREKHLGKKATCPDCGTKTVIVRPKPEPAVGPVGVPDGEEYQLDPESAPTPRSVPKPIALRHAELKEESRKAAEERENAGRKQKKKRSALREQPVKFPLVQRVPVMLLTAPVISRWVVLSVGLVVVAWFGSFGAGEASSKFHAVAMVCFFVVAVILGLLWLAAAAALWLAILTESADGHDELHHPPSTNVPDWFGETAYFAFAASASAAPAAALGALVAKIAEAQSFEVGQISTGTVAIGWLLTFPITILSSLEQGSALAVFSPKIGKSLLTCFPTWLLFYGESILLMLGTVTASGWLVLKHPLLVFVAAPLLFAATLLYFRLIGRLAWCLSELTAVEVTSES